MGEQITLFQDEEEKTLEVVKMRFIEKEYTCIDELFRGFNHLYAITFSYGLDFISEIIDYFDTAEIIIGCEAMVKFDLKTVMAFQTRALEEMQKYKCLIDRVREEKLSFWVAKEILSHEKVYILANDTGRTRVIVGSANFSRRSFSGDQRENIGYFENDPLAFDFYMKEFEMLQEFSTNEVVKEALFVNPQSDEASFENIPIIREARINKTGIILENHMENELAVEFVYDIKSLVDKYEKIVPRMEKKGNKTFLSSDKVIQLFKNFRKVKEEEKERQAKYPQFRINYAEGLFSFNEKPYDSNVDMEQVKQDLLHIEEYFAGFDTFIGEVEQMKGAYFRMMNYMFLSPFIAKLRYEAYKNDFSTILFPMYAIINGPKSAGKSAFMNTVQSIMFGQKLGGMDPDFFTKVRVYGLLKEATGAPLHIEDIDKDRFSKYCGAVVKYEEGILKEKLINHPVIIMTANDIETIKPEFAKRVYYAPVDAQLTNISAASMHKKMVVLRKKITTSFYREYLKRMFKKVLQLIEDMNAFELNEENEDWKPDIFADSSQTILEIYEECGLVKPSYVTKLNYSDYFGYNMSAEKIRDKIIFEWKHNRKAFKVLRRQNILEYTAGERSYEADRVCHALPEILRAKRSGIKVVMQLDEAEKFFGIYFKGKFF